MRFKEVERILLDDGWVYKNAKGSHMQYIHPEKPGKVTIPFHGGDIPLGVVTQIWKQAGIERRKR